MSKDHALEEVRSLFPRQKKVNAIDVFITTSKKPHQKFNFGNVAHCDTFNLITPEKKPNSDRPDRYFSGSELSLAVCEGYNDNYGLIALIAQMHQMTKNRSVGREIVRAFVKHAIHVTSMHLSEYANDPILSGSSMVLKEKDAFYFALFDPEKIKKEMRIHSKQAKIWRHTRPKGGNTNIRINSSFSSHDFVTLCKENNLGAIEPIIKAVLTLGNPVQRDSAFLNIGKVVQSFARPTDNAFYKNLNKLFQEKESL